MAEAKVEIYTYLFFNKPLKLPKLKKIIPVFDVNNEFGDMYGTKIVSGSMKNRLTKALFIIGKDGDLSYWYTWKFGNTPWSWKSKGRT